MENQVIIALKNNKLLKNILFEGLNLEGIKGNLLTISQGQILFREDDDSLNIYLVISGEINLLRKRGQGKAESLVFGEHDFFGCGEFLEGIKRKSTAVALRDSYIIALSKPDIDSLIEQNDEVLANIYESVSEAEPNLDDQEIPESSIEQMDFTKASVSENSGGDSTSSFDEKTSTKQPKILSQDEPVSSETENKIPKRTTSPESDISAMLEEELSAPTSKNLTGDTKSLNESETVKNNLDSLEDNPDTIIDQPDQHTAGETFSEKSSDEEALPKSLEKDESETIDEPTASEETSPDDFNASNLTDDINFTDGLGDDEVDISFEDDQLGADDNLSESFYDLSTTEILESDDILDISTPLEPIDEKLEKMKEDEMNIDDLEGNADQPSSTNDTERSKDNIEEKTEDKKEEPSEPKSESSGNRISLKSMGDSGISGEHLESINKAAQLVNSNIKIDDVLQNIVSVASELTGADRGTLYLVDKEKKELWSKIAMGNEFKEIKLAVGEGIAGWVAEKGDIISIENAQKDSRFNISFDKSSGYVTKSMLCFPIKNKDGEIVGVLQLLNSKNGKFSKLDEEFLEALSTHAAIALQNAGLVEQLLKSERISSLGKMANFLIQDIKKPIMISKRYTEHLKSKDISEEAMKVVDMLLDQLNHIADLVNATSSYSEGQIVQRSILRNLNEVLDDFLTRIDSYVKSRNCRITKEYGCDVNVKVSGKQLYQGFQHIIKNACDSMSEGGEILLTTEAVNGNVTISIKDSGIGIPESLHEKIFEPFMSHGKKEGTGLGLSITKKIIEEHEGHIDVESEIGEGTQIIITLPVESAA